jgi:hypothetical protein
LSMPAKMDGGGNVKVVVRVRAFLKRGKQERERNSQLSQFLQMFLRKLIKNSLQSLNVRQNV